jgi:hypothetical protein
MDYLSEHYNRVGDEAKLWIAKIIIDAKLDQRNAEAETLLRGVVAAHRDGKQTLADLEAAKQLKSEAIGTVLPRPERAAQALLIDLLKKEGKSQAAASEVQAYADQNKGHPSVKTITGAE